MGYNSAVIRAFRHKGLMTFFATGAKSGIRPEHEVRLRLILGRLQAATLPWDMDLPGLRFHPLKGRAKGRFSVSVSGNWRVTFGFSGNDAVDVDYEDYH